MQRDGNTLPMQSDKLKKSLITDVVKQGILSLVEKGHFVDRLKCLPSEIYKQEKSCHARISTSYAQLGNPELQIDFIPGFGGTQRLPHLVGLSKSLEMILTSKPVKRENALTLGLVDAITSKNELLSTASDKLEPLGEARDILNFARTQARG
ncbi:hypothetical protein ACET3Z_024362 [Daucus carota]